MGRRRKAELPFPTPPRPGLAHSSDIMRALLRDPDLTRDAKGAIKDGVPHWANAGCPCIACHRAFGTIPPVSQTQEVS